MFEKGTCIVYGTTGVCRVEEIGPIKGISGSDPGKVYYKLKSVRSGGTIYIPVDSKVFMRRVMTKQEADDLIHQMPSISEEVCNSRDQRILNEHYKASLRMHSCEELVRLIKSVYVKNRRLIKSGKKVGKTDLEYRKKAENLLYDELSVSLEVPFEQVKRYVENQVKNMGKERTAAREVAQEQT